MKITKVKHDSKGEIIEYQLDNGSIVSKEEVVNLAYNGEIEGVMVSRSKSNEYYVRSTPDGDKSNNLDNLPEIQ
ncbi:DUF3892 domain-containing protein [Clostridium cylindrosporum]|uniref:DUF3892 domain-containing protein n=1 Tax=Clostridium cylindrosporum DSM 605 TaxID=1121307 RepID=A0A0J8D8G5_CLOCY|nr:DUF3892 domain-containing protein [Clostridium cylindrosporum]KMT22350.1 hypothetical protein CLCY_19c00010 [Clostridium cylindrosporum DSM 605]